MAMFGRHVTGKVFPLDDLLTEHDEHVNLVHRSTPWGDSPPYFGTEHLQYVRHF